MTGVGVSEMSALWVENAIEAGDEHAGRDVCIEDLVGLLQRLARRGTPSLGNGAEDALCIGHHQRLRYAMTGGVPYYQSQPTVFQL